MTRKTALAIVALIYLCNFSIAYGKDVVIHSSNGNNGLELVNLDPPQVTYDEELNELYVYFGSSGTINLECDDGTGTPEATDDVHLGEGFIVENGATFAIKTPGKVTIDGCVFQSGAKVKIEAGNIEIAGKFTAEHGSVVEFKQFVD